MQNVLFLFRFLLQAERLLWTGLGFSEESNCKSHYLESVIIIHDKPTNKTKGETEMINPSTTFFDSGFASGGVELGTGSAPHQSSFIHL